jgi:hypothetical protein
MEILVCMMIDVEEASIGLLVRCMMLFVQIADRIHRFLSSHQKTDQSTAGIVTRREGQLDIEPSNDPLHEHSDHNVIPFR